MTSESAIGLLNHHGGSFPRSFGLPTFSKAMRGQRPHSRRETMLVLSRKEGERIQIGDQVTVTVVRISRSGVRIGIEAPVKMPIVRGETATKPGEDEMSPAPDEQG